MRHRPLARFLSAVLAVWFAMLVTEPVPLDACPMHSARSHAMDHGGSSGVHTGVHTGAHADMVRHDGALLDSTYCGRVGQQSHGVQGSDGLDRAPAHSHPHNHRGKHDCCTCNCTCIGHCAGGSTLALFHTDRLLDHSVVAASDFAPTPPAASSYRLPLVRHRLPFAHGPPPSAG